MEPQKQNGKRIGRPTKAPAAHGRVQLGIQVSPDLKTRLDAEATRNRRTQSREAEMRLARSFWLDDMLKAGLVSASAALAEKG